MASEALWTSHPPSEMDQNGGTRLWRFLRAMSGLILGVYVIRVFDSIFSSCQILLTFQSCVAQLSIIFSLPRVSCTSKGRFFYSGMLLLLLPEKCALYRLGFWSLWLKLGIDVLSSLFFFFPRGKNWGENASRMQKKSPVSQGNMLFEFCFCFNFLVEICGKHRETTAVATSVSFLTNGPYSQICWNEDEICRTRTRISLPVASRACVRLCRLCFFISTSESLNIASQFQYTANSKMF